MDTQATPRSASASTREGQGGASALRRWLAFTGVAPLGAFVIVHLATTATALWGPAKFERVFARTPAFMAATLAFVVLPLAVHAVLGTWLAIARPYAIADVRWWGSARRMAALTTLVFLVLHVFALPVHGWTGAMPSTSLYDATAAQLSSTVKGVPLVALGYLLGLAATLFHFATSMWTFLTTWSLVYLPSGRRTLGWGLAVVSMALFFAGGNTVVYFATGNRLVGPKAPAFAPCGPPPARCGDRP